MIHDNIIFMIDLFRWTIDNYFIDIKYKLSRSIIQKSYAYFMSLISYYIKICFFLYDEYRWLSFMMCLHLRKKCIESDRFHDYTSVSWHTLCLHSTRVWLIIIIQISKTNIALLQPILMKKMNYRIFSLIEESKQSTKTHSLLHQNLFQCRHH